MKHDQTETPWGCIVYILLVAFIIWLSSCTASKPVKYVYKPVHVNTGAGDSLIGYEALKVHYVWHVRLRFK